LAFIIATIILRRKWYKNEDFIKIEISCSKQKAGQIVCSAFTDFAAYPASTSTAFTPPSPKNAWHSFHKPYLS